MLGSGNPTLTARQFSDFRSSITPRAPPPQTAARDPATDIYRLLDNYAADITKAGEADAGGMQATLTEYSFRQLSVPELSTRAGVVCISGPPVRTCLVLTSSCTLQRARSSL